MAFGLLSTCFISAQESQSLRDSLYISEVEEIEGSYKVLHAEPLYIDLIRDLGARKGEKEWNVGLGLTDNLKFDSYEALVEYEWAPVNRLGMEVELPFTYFAPVNGTQRDSVPSARLNSLKVAAQWTFLVSEAYSTSMAIGYINEFEFSDFASFGKPLIFGNVYNPFLIAARRWGNNFHSLIYTGPVMHQHFAKQSWHAHYDINTSIHYMISGTRNFIGVEFNKTLENSDFDMTIRPQMRLSVADNLLVGIVAGVPIERENERFSAFIRLIWEPRHK